MVITHNLSAMNTQRQFNIVRNRRMKSAEKLSSGYRINRAGDDAAGLAISEKMRRQIRGLNAGKENIQDGISLIQVADGALSEVNDMLHRMTELAVKAANGTNTFEDRQAIQSEINALKSEITRIGKTTTFNEQLIFDDMYGTDDGESVTQLVSSSAADSGYLTEAIQVNSYWLPAASIDFTNINENNISKLNGQGFSFSCSRGCNEVFDFKFYTDGTPSSASNLSGKVTHYYELDISNCKSGSEIINALYELVENNPPINNLPDGANKLTGALEVSHSNYMLKSADGNQLIIYANRRIAGHENYVVQGYATEEEAKAAYPCNMSGVNSWAGAIDCSNLTAMYEEDKMNEISIRGSSGDNDYEIFHTHRMNSIILGIDNVSVMTEKKAGVALTAIKKASEKISSHRSELGAFQNRLEPAYAVNMNLSENTTDAESRIRDTDMAKEMVEQSKQNILEQVGMSVMAQANQQNQGILSLIS